ncbi:MAG: sigma-54-dependent Fis family transcriptional regulator [Gammaproteobacteria bacterium]|nr:sigma-54-dependent Fis family transcriptional regulator [Gammaproteobacteria bacterium]
MRLPTLYLNVNDFIAHEALTECSLSAQLSLLDHSEDQDWLKQLQQVKPDIAVIELNQFSAYDEQQLSQFLEQYDVELILISDGLPNAQLDTLTQTGAIFHFRSPLNIELLTATIDDIAAEKKQRSQKRKTITTSNLDQYGLLLGSSSEMHKLFRTIRRIAKSNSNVFIIGESGVGKELVANTIHLSSLRSEQPFLAINCGAISPELVDSELFGHVKGAFTGANQNHQGVFTQAKGGTLFLDEISEMPLEHQVKLLRVLETGEYRPVGSTTVLKADVRVLAATNRVPQEAIDEERLREDLYFRLAHFPLSVPPLRVRGDDITELTKHFIAYHNAEQTVQKAIEPEALEQLAQHTWPGNVRELKHTIERAFLLADSVIQTQHIKYDMADSANPDIANDEADTAVPSGISLEELEKAAIMNTLSDNDGNKTETANDLGISVKTLYNKLDKY